MRTCRSINLEGFKRFDFEWLHVLCIYTRNIINMQKKANDEPWQSLEKQRGRGGGGRVQLSGILLYLSHSAKPCLPVCIVLDSAPRVMQVHTLSMICEQFKENEEEDEKQCQWKWMEKQKKRACLESIAIILWFKDKMMAGCLLNIHTLNKWVLYRRVAML